MYNIFLYQFHLLCIAVGSFKPYVYATIAIIANEKKFWAKFYKSCDDSYVFHWNVHFTRLLDWIITTLSNFNIYYNLW